MIKNIEVLTIEDGGNPRTMYDIMREEKGFLIHPFSEDNDGNYRFRLNVEIVNNSKEKIPVLFNIEWGDVEHQEARKYLLLSYSDDHWERFDTDINGTIASAIIKVPPGRSILCMHPRYEYGHFLKLVCTLPGDIFSIRKIGKSRKNRDVLAIEAGNKKKRPLVVMSRVHPYETIGSYFVDGMLKWLITNEEDAEKLLQENNIIFLPMPNPDGVAEGTCKLTLGGLNFEAGFYENCAEPEGAAVRDYLLEKNPSAILDLHGWMYDRDIILSNDPERGRTMYANLTSNTELFDKVIAMVYAKYPMFGRECNISAYIANKQGAVYFDTSWSWYGKTADILRNMGIHLLKVYSELF